MGARRSSSTPTGWSATHRTASLRALDLDALGISRNVRGYLSVDAMLQTAVDGIRAIGGVIGAGSSPTRIRHQARQVAHWALLGHGLSGEQEIPFLDSIHAAPELATLGASSAERPGLLMATTRDSGRGLKLVADEHHRVVGLHAWGPNAEKRLQALETAVQQKWRVRRLRRGHPPHR